MPVIRLGLRFSRSQARVLRNLAEWCKANGVPGDVTLYERAAESAEDGEPLVVHCNDPSEVEQMQAAFVTIGIKRPTIEQLV